LLTYITHSYLDESREYFNGKHLVVLHKDLDRFMNTSWKFRVGKTKRLVSELYTEEQIVEMLDSIYNNYKDNITEDDFVIESIDELFDQDTFKNMCNKLELEFNEDRYIQVKRFINANAPVK